MIDLSAKKKRRLDEDGASDDLANLNGGEGSHGGVDSDEEPPDPNMRRIAQLEGNLQHLRKWMQALQSYMQLQPMHKDTVNNSQRLFIGSVPCGTTDEELSQFLCDTIIATGAAVGSGRPITYCRVQPGKNFAFVQLRSAEEASNAMALEGVRFKDVPLKVRRPSKFDPKTSIMLGPLEPDPTMDLSKVTIIKTLAAGSAAAAAAGGPGGAAAAPDREQHPTEKHESTPNTLYIGGLPLEWTADQCIELLKMYGEVKHFRLMFDRTNKAAPPTSKGFAFAEYSTDEATVAALEALNGAQLGLRRITANRALEHKEKERLRQQHGGQMGTGASASMGGWGNRAGGGRGGSGGGFEVMSPMAGRAGSGMAGGMGAQAAPAPGLPAGGIKQQQQLMMQQQQQQLMMQQQQQMQQAPGSIYGSTNGLLAQQYGMAAGQQGLYGYPPAAAAAGGNISGGAGAVGAAVGAQPGLAGASAAQAASLQGMNSSMQGMYAMPGLLQPAAPGQQSQVSPAGGAAAGYAALYGSGAGQVQQQQTGGITGYGSQLGSSQQGQAGMAMVAGGQPGSMGVLTPPAGGMGMPGGAFMTGAGAVAGDMGSVAGGYQPQQLQQQPGYQAALGGVQQRSAVGQLGVPSVQQQNTAATSGPPGAGGGGGWQGQQQVWTPTW